MFKKMALALTLALVMAIIPMGIFAAEAALPAELDETAAPEAPVVPAAPAVPVTPVVPAVPAAPQLIPTYAFGDLMEFYVEGPEQGIFVDRYGGTIWFEGDFIMPELAYFTLDDDTVMLPFRDVVEGLLAGSVYWDGSARIISAEVRGAVIGIPIDGATFPIIIVNDRIYVPADIIEGFFLNQ